MQLEAGTNGGAGSASMNAAIKDVMPLFHAQLQESAAHGLDDSQMDARGKLDFQLVKDVVEQGHASARVMIQLDLEHILRCFEALQSAEVTLAAGGNTEAMFEEYHARTRNTVVGTTDQRVWGRSSERGRVPCSHHPRCHHSTTRPWRVRCTLRLCRISWPREWNQ